MYVCKSKLSREPFKFILQHLATILVFISPFNIYVYANTLFTFNILDSISCSFCVKSHECVFEMSYWWKTEGTTGPVRPVQEVLEVICTLVL